MRFFEKAFKSFYQYYNFLLGSAVGKIFPLWITPNGISVFRAFLFLPVLILLLLDFQIPAFVLFVFAAYLDSVDGLLARSRQAMSELGAAVDALMDKMFFICLIVPTVFLMDYSTTTVFYPILVFSSLSLIVPVEVWLTIVRWQDYQQFAAKRAKNCLSKQECPAK